MKIVVVGAGAAGLAAATRAKRVAPHAQVMVFEKTSEYSRGTCSLPFFVSGELDDPNQLRGLSAEQLGAAGVELKLRTAALEIQPHQRRLITDGPAVHYDRLIVATGSRQKANPFKGLEQGAERVWRLRSQADADKILRDLGACRPRKAAIVGGGYVGVELAEALLARGLQVSILHRKPTLMRLHPAVNQAVVESLQSQGIEVELNLEVEGAEPSAGLDSFLLEGHLSTGERFQSTFDAVALAHGIEPAADLLSKAGARLGSSGGVLVNSRGETSLNQVYACGDGVEIPNSRGGPGRWIPLATTAARLGRVCGENAAGGSLRLGANLAALSIRLFHNQLGMVGQPRDWQDSSALEFHWGNRNSPFPRRRNGQGVLFFEPGTERVKGVQAFGAEAASLVNVVSMAVEQELTIHQLAQQDFTYTPPLSALWHPLYLASRGARNSTRVSYAGGRSR